MSCLILLEVEIGFRCVVSFSTENGKTTQLCIDSNGRQTHHQCPSKRMDRTRF